ncbi:KH domain-containing, RNA-binding, signal transduction-associated protein 3-like isoform X3 [Narcine bancroftii]|uniref:KH domain-containing, RNA-binding, signal transduction-associated protein 3-like isoform X3 n=1 Tax=Narcine bancroftii TaxID=1343680 RepID=UPI0038317BFA
MEDEKYLPELMAEKDSLDPSFVHASRLVTAEISKIEAGEGSDEEKFVDVVSNKNMKLAQKVLIPVKQFPKFNFVGKLLGPRGNSLKRLQEETLTKMSILGKGSMRDKAKEEELRKSGESKYAHLNEDLHVLIEVFAPPSEAYARMGHALDEVKKFLIPDYNDEIRQQQLQELSYLNGTPESPETPSVRGKPVRGRGAIAPALTRGRGGVPPPTSAVPRAGPVPRGAPPGRGPGTRGRGVPAPRARGAPGYRPPPPPVQNSTYGEYGVVFLTHIKCLGDMEPHRHMVMAMEQHMKTKVTTHMITTTAIKAKALQIIMIMVMELVRSRMSRMVRKSGRIPILG